MSLYLVGENIDKSRSYYQAETGKIIQLMRGIYVDSDDDTEATVLRYGIRIAKYLYPRTYLSAASAVLLRPTNDGKLYISGPRNQRTRIRSLEIIQNKAPISPSIATAIVDDGMGEFKTDVSSIKQRFLEAFRMRSEHAASIDITMRAAIAQRVIEEYGSPGKAADAIWAIARINEWYKEGEQAERYLRRDVELKPARNEAELNLVVAWHGKLIGILSHDGFEWRWIPSEGNFLPLVRQTVPGKLPPFIDALLPEGWLENVLRDKDERVTLRSGRRYMSNITIVENEEEISQLPVDVLETPLSQYSRNGLFTGKYAGPAPGEIEESFERNLVKIYENADTPRLSGVQIKAPMYLSPMGVLSPGTTRPFTHILKPGGTGGFEFLPVIEWLSLYLGRRVGFNVPDFALMRMPNEMPPALLVERFDIRRSGKDPLKIALEDFCSLLGLSATDKYNGTIEQAARALKGISTEPDQDIRILLKRALFAWLIADGDMHLKNLAVVKIAVSGDNVFKSVRMSPLYDPVTTVIFPNLKNDRMALKMNGKDNRIKRADFMKLASSMGIKISEAESLIASTVAKLALAINQAELPDGINYGKAAENIAQEMLETCRIRLNAFK